MLPLMTMSAPRMATPGMAPALPPTMTVPLYQSGAVYSQVRQARQQAAASRLNADQARRDVTSQVRQAWHNLGDDARAKRFHR